MNEFSLANAASTMILCFISVFVGGIISDKFNPGNPMIKTYVQVLSTLASVPFVALTYSFPQGQFWFCMENLALNYLFSEAWASPTVTMLLDAAPPEAQGLAVNVYLLFSSVAAIISTSTFDFILDKFFDNDPKAIGELLTIISLISYLGSVFAFIGAGYGYRKLYHKADVEEEEAMNFV